MELRDGQADIATNTDDDRASAATDFHDGVRDTATPTKEESGAAATSNNNRYYIIL